MRGERENGIRRAVNLHCGRGSSVVTCVLLTHLRQSSEVCLAVLQERARLASCWEYYSMQVQAGVGSLEVLRAST